MAQEEENSIQVFVGDEYFTVPITSTDQLIENVKQEVENKKGIAIDKQRLYHEGEPLQKTQTLLEGDILFVEDTRNPTKERNWAVDVYGNFNGSLAKVAVPVPYPY